MHFIDIGTQTLIDDGEVKRRLLPTVYNRLNDADVEVFTGVGVAVIEIIETEPPVVSEPYHLIDDGYDKSKPGVWVRQWSVVPPDIHKAKNYQQAIIQRDYNTAKLDPVEVLGALWRGGFESAQGIKGAIDMCEEMGQPTVTLFDVNNAPHQYTLPQARQIALGVGLAYQAVFARRAAKLIQLANAVTPDQALAVDWHASD